MEIRSKPPEVLEAQLATYAAEELSHEADRLHVLNNIGALAARNGTEVVTRVLSEPEWVKDNGSNQLHEAGAEREAVRPDDYAAFLRRTGGRSHEGIQRRAELIRNYGRFEAQVDDVLESIKGTHVSERHEDQIGRGAGARVIKIANGNKEYAVRTLIDAGRGPGSVESYVEGAVLFKGRPRFEQMEAVSYIKGVTVSELIEGERMNQMTAEEIKAVSDEQLSNLADDVIYANGRGAHIDPKPDNFLYDSKLGYTLLDLGVSPDTSEVGIIVGQMADVIECTGHYATMSETMVYDLDSKVFAEEAVLLAARISVLQRYRNQVSQKLDGDQQAIALSYIDTVLTRSQMQADNYSNPDWVTKTITANQVEKERRRQRVQSSYDPGQDDPDFNFM